MQTLTTEQLEQMKNRKPDLTLLNVLPADKYREAHIPGSLSIPLTDDDFVAHVEQVADKNDDVVVYCASTECDMSPQAAKQLETAGFGSVYDYEGGTKAWKKAGHCVQSGS